MHPSIRNPLRCGAAALAVLALAGPAHAQKLGEGASGRATSVQRDSAARRVVAMVYEGIFSDVRIETAEPGAAANQQPVTWTVAELKGALAQIQLDKQPLFNDDQLAEIVPHLVAALARATSAQDVSFAVPARPLASALLPREVTTARVFQTAEGLQVIVGLARRPFEGEFIATGHLIAFEPGRRAAPVDAHVQLSAAGPDVRLKRADWVALQPPSAASAALAPAPEARPAPPPAPSFAPAAPAAPAVPAVPAVPAAVAPAAAPAAPALPRAVAPATPPAPPPAAAPAPTPEAGALYRSTRERLKALQQLRDDGLISAQEYEAKRRAILGDL